MTHYLIDERDIMFNAKECPGLSPITSLEAFSEIDEETFDMIYEQGKTFSERVLAPLSVPGDREGCQWVEGNVRIPEGIAEAWEQYRELGFIGINSPGEYGGAELPHFVSMPVAEMETGSFVSFSMLPLLTRGSARLILGFGSQKLKDTYVEKMFSGQWTGTMCLTEPGAGSDVGAGVTRAIPEGDHYRITGTKIFITWGDHELTENIIHLVLARVPDSPRGSKGLSLFVVPKFLVDEAGNPTSRNDVECGNIEHKMGINASPTCVINFGPNEGSIGYLVGEVNYGMRYMFQMMNEARIEVGVQGMAVAAAAYMSAVQYAKERVQGSIKNEEGVRPARISEHPDVRRMLVRMRALVHGMRAMLYTMAQYVDLAHQHPSESDKYQALVGLLTPLCKSYCSDQGFRVTEMAIQTYGGYGYTQEYPVEQYMRDAKISSIYEGTNGIQALDLVFRKILMDQGAALRLLIGDVVQLVNDLNESSLKNHAESLLKGFETLGMTAQTFGAWYASGKVEQVQFRATDFQMEMGHLVIGYFLLRQAAKAEEVLASKPDHKDKVFYEQKIVTAGFFIQEQVIQATFALRHLQSEPTPGLEAQF